jgi:glucose/arabinose dehydrogenase
MVSDRSFPLVLAAFLTVLAWALPTHAQLRLDPVLSGLVSPVFATSAGDGSNRLFIVEQPGLIKVLPPGASSPTVFLDIQRRVLFGGEQGLLGLAFHPRFAENGRFFVNYTRRLDGATVIAEFRRSALDPNVASPRQRKIRGIPQPFANHNGGMLAFGPDGFLYAFLGDGGSGNDPGNRAQDTRSLLGTILRIDIDLTTGGKRYASPPDNPFFGRIPGRAEIYATGFRNPWRASFDRLTGELYVGDVGQGEREEVDRVVRGGNYGWRIIEGTRCTGLEPNPTLCLRPDLLPPIAEYDHLGGRCSVTGGYVYRGTRSSLPLGVYVYGDFCTGEIFLLQNGSSSLALDTAVNISSFGEDEEGEILVVDINGVVYRIASGGGV